MRRLPAGQRGSPSAEPCNPLTRGKGRSADRLVRPAWAPEESALPEAGTCSTSISSMPPPKSSQEAAQAHQPTVVTESNLPNGVRRDVVTGPCGQSMSDVSSADARQEFRWAPLQNEGNVLEALHRLRDTLNEQDPRRPWSGEVAHNGDVDGWLVPQGAEDRRAPDPPLGALACEVTRVERATLRTRSREALVTTDLVLPKLVDAVVAAIESKENEANTGVVLVLDANDAPAYTMNLSLVSLVQSEIERLNIGDRWAAIWLVGPTTGRTCQLR